MLSYVKMMDIEGIWRAIRDTVWMCLALFGKLFSAGVKKKEENTTQTGRLRVQDAIGDVSRATQLQAHSFINLYKHIVIYRIWNAYAEQNIGSPHHISKPVL